MTQNLTRATLIVLLAGLATACATGPTYPTHAGEASPPPSAPMQPRYPIREQAAATPPPPVATATPPETPPTAPPPSAAVESQALPPVVQAPPPAAAPPPPAAYAPPPSRTATYEPAPIRARPAPVRYLAGGKVVAATGMFRDYEVQKKDHVDAIARDLDTTRKVIVDANHLKAPYALQPGQHLKVPVAMAYETESGDTLAVVAKRFDIAPEDLASLNDLSTRGRLRQGEKIALPANYHDRGPSRIRAPIEEVRAAPPPRPRPTPAPARAPYRTYAAAPSTTPYAPSAARGAAPYPYAAHPYVPSAPSAYIAHPYVPSASSAHATSRPVYAPIAPPTDNARAATDSEITAAARGRFIWPVRGQILSAFGAQGVGRRNDGVDVKSPQGTVVRAAAGGDVVYAGNQVPGFGNLVLVKHADGWVTAYAHLDKVSVQMRQAVIQGQEIGQVGLSGGVSEPQLHFEVRYAPTPADKARPIDPLLVLPKENG